MKKLNKKLIVTNYNGGIATALYQDGKPVELSFDRSDSGPLLGNIYIGKVTQVVKNINAAFVEIEDGIPCYFSLEKKEQPLFTKKGNSSSICAGDELLVQVSREAVKTKAPSVTSRISRTGKFLVLTYGKSGIGYSTKLSSGQKAGLRNVMQPFLREEYGWILRTNAGNATEEQLISEAQALLSGMDTMIENAMHRTCRSCMYRTPPEYLMCIRNIYSGEYDEILTDDPVIHKAIVSYLQEFQPLDMEKLRFYQDRLLPLSKLYALETAFDEALRERVWLRSGGYLVIQPTEALTVIDVNTGKYDGKKNTQDTFLKINLEAAVETARHLRLRNLSGIIIVDFINMESEDNKKQLMKILSDCLSKDPKKAVVVDMTPLGLVEITRKREQKSLREKFYEKQENL